MPRHGFLQFCRDRIYFFFGNKRQAVFEGINPSAAPVMVCDLHTVHLNCVHRGSERSRSDSECIGYGPHN